MIRALTIVIFLLGGSAGAATVADEAKRAAEEMRSAVTALQEAGSARDRVAALTETISAYERGLSALRQALRQAHLREMTLELQFQAKREEVARLLGLLGQVEASPGPLLLLHPTGPLGTVRSAMMLADVTPALQAGAEALRAELTELRNLRVIQDSARQLLTDGLVAAQAARSTLSQAISERTDLPRGFTEDPEALRRLLDSADTLDAFAGGIILDDRQPQDFLAARGSLPLPVFGTLLRRANEPDAAGVRRPGVTLATRARALVTTPWPATLRYAGPLLDYGNVIVLEPGAGYLFILAGLETVYGELGEVLPAGAPLGLMGGGASLGGDLMAEAQEGSGVEGTETLYMELRQGADPVDPAEWFAALKE